jgi:hypothetical protein
MTSEMVSINLEQVHLDFPPPLPAQSWQASQRLATPASRWNAYLNDLALQALLPWLQDESLVTPVQPAYAHPHWLTLWELVSGSAIQVGPLRLVLLPTTAIDADELRIPQEWIDIPAWVADYYLSVHVNPDEGWAKILGFASHQTIKSQAQYDWLDRTYSLDASDLTADLNVLWVSHQLYPDAIARAAVTPLPNLTTAQAHQLIDRLGQPQVLNPRLAIGFQQWGALIAHDGWRKQLAYQRWGIAHQGSVRQWLTEGLSHLANQLGWQPITYQTVTVGGRGTETPTPQVGFVRQLQIAAGSYTLQISLLPDTENAWRFELSGQNTLIPPGLTLRLLTEDLQPFDNNQVTADTFTERLAIDVALANAEGLVWEIDPIPNQYEREILRF